MEQTYSFITQKEAILGCGWDGTMVDYFDNIESFHEVHYEMNKTIKNLAIGHCFMNESGILYRIVDVLISIVSQTEQMNIIILKRIL